MTSKKKKKIDIVSDDSAEEVTPTAAAEEAAVEEKDTVADEMTKEIEKYKKMAEENFKLYQYSMAELDNLKRRAIADRTEMRKYGIIPFARDIMHVVDNLDRALEHLETADKESLTQGITMTLEEFNKALENHGIRQVPAVGKFFDPNIHEGFVMVETNSYSPNTVIEEFQKGYMLDERLVRPAKVSVSVERKGDEPPAETAEEVNEVSPDAVEIEVNEE